MDCNSPGSFVHGISQARILEWVAISFSRRSSWPRDWTQVSHIVGRRFTIWATKQHTVVDVTGNGSKVWCYKEQYCIGTWNVRSMNQGKLEVVKQEMATVNIDILGISEIKWTGMGEFNSDDHYIYYCGQESLRRNRVAITVNKSLKCSTWMQNDLCSFPRQTIQYHSNSSLCPNQ